MQLYNSLGPNPRVVRMFMAEKGIDLPTTEVDVRGGENRQGPYLELNPGGQLPALELEDGSVIAEITAICEYLEDTSPEPAMIGANAVEKAETRMWARRCDLGVCEPLANGFRFAEGLALFKDRMRCLPEAADGLKASVQDKLAWLDGLLEGKQFLAGDRFTLADIMLYSFLDFGASVGQSVDPKLAALGGWYGRVASRPSASASIHPAAGDIRG
ncbi:MAG: glutathione S-transferase family protein [Acidobacteriota bacterium]|nr:glutathione S-transferase family protein [Acidobacteriota bacterium]